MDEEKTDYGGKRGSGEGQQGSEGEGEQGRCNNTQEKQLGRRKITRGMKHNIRKKVRKINRKTRKHCDEDMRK